jgi:hypothetical protein
MSIAVAARPRLQPDDIFFPAMAMLILTIVFIGFAQSYFLAGMVGAKLPNKLVHIHGALFVLWVLFLLAQTLLAASGEIRWHMRLGVVGLVMPPVMVGVAVLTLIDSIRRSGTDLPPELIFTSDLEEVLLFAAYTMAGVMMRRNAAAHKRLMILGTMAMLGPAIARFPIDSGALGIIGIYVTLPTIVVAYDFWSRRRLHHCTAICYGIMASAMLTLLPVSRLPVWHHLVERIGH